MASSHWLLIRTCHVRRSSKELLMNLYSLCWSLLHSLALGLGLGSRVILGWKIFHLNYRIGLRHLSWTQCNRPSSLLVVHFIQPPQKCKRTRSRFGWLCIVRQNIRKHIFCYYNPNRFTKGNIWI